MRPCMEGRGLYYSGIAVQMLQLQDFSAHFSQFCVGPVSSLMNSEGHICLYMVKMMVDDGCLKGRSPRYTT